MLNRSLPFHYQSGSVESKPPGLGMGSSLKGLRRSLGGSGFGRLVGIDPPDFDLPNEPRRCAGETVGTGWFLYGGDALGAYIGKERGEASTTDYYVVAGEGDACFIVAAFGVDELAPGKDDGSLYENDLQRH